MAKSGGNKSARIYVPGGKGSGGSQPWFDKNLVKRRRANKTSKQARKRNRKR